MAGRLQPTLRLGARRPRARELGAVTAGKPSRAHTPSGGLLNAGDDSRRHGECVCARVCGTLAQPPPPTFLDATQAAVGFRGPSGLGFCRGPEGISYEISACLEAAGNGLRRHARLPTSGK